MKLVRLAAFGLISAFAADAFAEGPLPIPGVDGAQPAIVKKSSKPGAHVKTAKPVQSGELGDIPFSKPNASPVGEAATSNGDFAAARKGAAKPPAPDVSLGLKWRATNEPVDPYDAVRHTSGPEGPGDTFEAGLKLGF
jgi:hypothetical protein